MNHREKLSFSENNTENTLWKKKKTGSALMSIKDLFRTWDLYPVIWNNKKMCENVLQAVQNTDFWEGKQSKSYSCHCLLTNEKA